MWDRNNNFLAKIAVYALAFLSQTEAVMLKQDPIPTIVYGGMGSSCKDPAYVRLVADLKKGLSSHAECYETTVQNSMTQQSHEACSWLRSHPVYGRSKEIYVVGVSQGGLVGRYIVEECDLGRTKVKKLLEIGSPNMGISVIPMIGCQNMKLDEDDDICQFEREMAKILGNSPVMQDNVASASYFRDPDDIEAYKRTSPFLASLNNENAPPSLAQLHKQRIKSLAGAMFVMFDKDEIVFPAASEIFGQLSKRDARGQRHIIPFEQSEIYQKDLLGLRSLQDQGKLKFIHINDAHTKYNEDHIWKIFIPFLKR